MSNAEQLARKKRNKPASYYLFPLAAAYAALLMPWSILALLYGVPAPAGLYSAFGHAHELLIGYAMLVVAGYLLGPLEGRKILLLIGVWLLARIGFLSLPGGLMAVAGAVLVAGLTAYWTVPRFARSAKKWR
ncbi:MAG: NnrS family protein, partial [Shewanella sp.]|nr:NnrS family protein [Shewanella sp.]